MVKPPRERPRLPDFESPFYSDRAVMRPDDRGIDHVRLAVSSRQIAERLQKGSKDAGLNPAAEAAKDAVPFAVAVGQQAPLRARARHPHHALEIAAVIARRPAPAPAFSRQQGADHRPLRIRQPNPFAQNRASLQNAALNQTSDDMGIPFVHETWTPPKNPLIGSLLMTEVRGGASGPVM